MARPREFDPEVALDRCLALFWARGFAAVSLSDIEEATGLGRQSLYSAFGNKEALYAAVLDRYAAATECWLAPLHAPDAGLAELRGFAARSLAAQRANGVSGCLAVKTLLDLGLDDPELQRRAQAATKQVRSAFERALARAVERGELPPGDDKLRADLCFAGLNGLAALRRAGSSEQRALALFDALLDSLSRAA